MTTLHRILKKLAESVFHIVAHIVSTFELLDRFRCVVHTFLCFKCIFWNKKKLQKLSRCPNNYRWIRSYAKIETSKQLQLCVKVRWWSIEGRQKSIVLALPPYRNKCSFIHIIIFYNKRTVFPSSFDII